MRAIKRITREEYAALVATATRDEVLQVLAGYVERRPGRRATGKAKSSTERSRERRARLAAGE